MAECIDLPVTPWKTNWDGSNNLAKQSYPDSDQKVLPRRHKVSLGSCSDGDSQRRKSNGNQSSPSTGKNVLPNYLRASTGSCHDFCKYGRKHAVEEKEKTPIRKKIPTPSSHKKNLIKPLAEQKKSTVVKVKLSPPSKINLTDPPEIIKQEVFLPSKKVDFSSKNDPSNDDKMKGYEKKIQNLLSRTSSVKPKPATVKPQSSLETSVVSNDRRNASVRIVTKTGITSACIKKSLAEYAYLSPSKKSSTSTVPRLNARKYKNLKMLSSPKDQNRIRKLESKSRQSNEEKVQETVVSLSARKYRSVKVVMPLKDQSKIRRAQSKQSNSDHVQVEEKTLHVVKEETKDKLLDSVQGGDILSSSLSLSLASTNPPSLPFVKEEVEEVSEYSDSEEDDFDGEEDDFDGEEDDLVGENKETVHMDEETSEWFNQKMPRKCGVVCQEDKDSAPVKVKFSRGKIIDLKSENNGPRRLKFRRGRMLGENLDNKADARRRNSKRREVDGETIDANASLEKVTLRHQDVQGKKDDKGLLNNVIEQTASKLVESRKGKVKALVGAFETVISLQDSSPYTQTVV